mmetsp:Transcript_11356/g.25812  ORF Transcript_11356/g.25812 Transcript_11356/m.25812 type:complete len:108 (-) Transcript_11356:81-404(-)
MKPTQVHHMQKLSKRHTESPAVFQSMKVTEALPTKDEMDMWGPQPPDWQTTETYQLILDQYLERVRLDPVGFVETVQARILSMEAVTNNVTDSPFWHSRGRYVEEAV